MARSSVGEPAFRRLPRSSLYRVNSGWIIGRPTRCIECQPPASVAKVDTAHTPIRRLPPAWASNSLSGTSSTMEYTVWPANKFFCASWIPSGKVDFGAILKSMADGVQHIRLDPEGVTGFACPNAETRCGVEEFAGCALCDHSAGRVTDQRRPRLSSAIRNRSDARDRPVR